MVVRFNDSPHVVAVAELAAVDSARLRQRAGDLNDYEHDLRRALERLFTGF